jgi:hypothetical protein
VPVISCYNPARSATHRKDLKKNDQPSLRHTPARNQWDEAFRQACPNGTFNIQMSTGDSRIYGAIERTARCRRTPTRTMFRGKANIMNEILQLLPPIAI